MGGPPGTASSAGARVAAAPLARRPMIRFGDLRPHPGRHVSHADEVITDVNRRRVMARARDDCFTIAWDYPGRTLLEVRILRSLRGPAETADEGPGEGQALVYQDVTGSFCDAGLDRARPTTTPSSRDTRSGEWVRWGAYSVPCEQRARVS